MAAEEGPGGRMMGPGRTAEVPEAIELPASTDGPLVVAFGIALIFAGMVTVGWVSVVGILCGLVGAVRWWWQVLPEEKHERIAVDRARESKLVIEPAKVPVREIGEVQHRMRIPVEVHPYSAGLKGGLVGGAAMAAVALLYGQLAQGSIWYPINLLAAVTSSSMASASLDQLRQFSVYGLVVGGAIHGLLSLLVGLLYAMILPMVVGSPVLWGGLVGPLLWSGGLWASFRVINPGLNARVDWLWFVVSQLAFGLACGWVVSRSARVRTQQTWPLSERAGLEIARPPRDGRGE